MILSFITGSFTLALLALVIALVQIGFWFTVGTVAVGLSLILAAAFALTTWATGRAIPRKDM